MPAWGQLSPTLECTPIDSRRYDSGGFIDKFGFNEAPRLHTQFDITFLDIWCSFPF